MQTINLERYEGVQFASLATAICTNLKGQVLGIECRSLVYLCFNVLEPMSHACMQCLDQGNKEKSDVEHNAGNKQGFFCRIMGM